MANENLQNAIDQSGLTLEAFAEVVRVDRKSVQRWVTGNTLPYPKHRRAITLALNLTEQELWPGRIPADEEDEGDAGGGNGDARACDVTGAWAYADADTAPDLVTLIQDTDGPVEILDSCLGLLVSTELTAVLAARASEGAPVRILTDGRAPHWETLLDKPGVQIFLCDIPGEYSLLKTGDRMILTINLEHDPRQGQPPPLLDLMATERHGLFDRFASTFEELWALTQDNEPQPPGPAAQNASPAAAAESAPADPGPEPMPPRPAPSAEPVPGMPGARRWPRQPDPPGQSDQ